MKDWYSQVLEGLFPTAYWAQGGNLALVATQVE